MEKEVFDNALNEEAYMKGISNLRKYFQGGYQCSIGDPVLFFFTGSRLRLSLKMAWLLGAVLGFFNRIRLPIFF